MLTHELINREWIVSRSARNVYRAAAVLSLLIPLLWIAIEDTLECSALFAPS